MASQHTATLHRPAPTPPAMCSDPGTRITFCLLNRLSTSRGKNSMRCPGSKTSSPAPSYTALRILGRHFAAATWFKNRPRRLREPTPEDHLSVTYRGGGLNEASCPADSPSPVGLWRHESDRMLLTDRRTLRYICGMWFN
ncbi:hypothetical protein PAMA_003663 [Pampus argenteus]